MKKKYIIPQSNIIVLEPTRLMAGSLTPGGQQDPILNTREAFDFDFTSSEDNVVDQLTGSESFLDFE